MRCYTYIGLYTFSIVRGGRGGLGTVCQLIAVNFPLRLPIEINLQICTESSSSSLAKAPLAVSFEFIFICIWISNHSVRLSICKCRWALSWSSLRHAPAASSLSLCLFVCLFTCGTFKLLLPRYTCPTWHNRFLKLFRKPKTLKTTTHTRTHSYTHIQRHRQTHSRTHNALIVLGTSNDISGIW